MLQKRPIILQLFLGESSQATVSDMTFGNKTLNAYTYQSGIVKVSVELLQDSAFDLSSYIRSAFARRLGAGINAHLTNGNGTGKPNGILNAASTGVTGAASAITRDDLLDLIHSVDPAYRNGAAFMLNDSTLAALKKLSLGTADARPLWVPSMRDGAPSTIEGFNYVINQDMPTIGTGNSPVAFGDWSQYVVRQAGSPTMVRLNERYADFLHVGFIAYQRVDGELIGTNAIKLFTNS